MMNHETALSQAREAAERVLAPAARQNDREGRFSTEAVDILGRAGLLRKSPLPAATYQKLVLSTKSAKLG
jgi:hypothetical protein